MREKIKNLVGYAVLLVGIAEGAWLWTSAISRHWMPWQ